MSLESTRGAAQPERERRDRLEQLQVELRETRALLENVREVAKRENAEQRKTFDEAEERLAKANRRLALLKERSVSCDERREAVKRRIHEVRVERDGPVQQVGLYNEQPLEGDWSVTPTTNYGRYHRFQTTNGAILYVVFVVVLMLGAVIYAAIKSGG